MRFSGGHDYYDSVLSHGRDESLFFNRSPLEKAVFLPHKESGFSSAPPSNIEFREDKSFRRETGFSCGEKRHDYETITIWFAGERFNGVLLTVSEPSKMGPVKVSHETFWNQEEFLTHLAKIEVKVVDNFYRSEGVRVREKDIREFFEKTAKPTDISWMVEKKVSIAISARSDHYNPFSDTKAGWYLNCDGLGKLGFARCLDPYSAYQKLSQWLGGVLSGADRPMVQIKDEKVVLAKHGFDKRSFKHRPPAHS